MFAAQMSSGPSSTPSDGVEAGGTAMPHTKHERRNLTKNTHVHARESESLAADLYDFRVGCFEVRIISNRHPLLSCATPARGSARRFSRVNTIYPESISLTNNLVDEWQASMKSRQGVSNTALAASNFVVVVKQDSNLARRTLVGEVGLLAHLSPHESAKRAEGRLDRRA